MDYDDYDCPCCDCEDDCDDGPSECWRYQDWLDAAEDD